MTFEPAVGEDVRHLDTFGVERLRDEMRPVAVQRLLLRAHECDAVLRGPADDPGDTVPEIARPGDPFITDMTAFVVQGGDLSDARRAHARGTRNGCPGP